MVSDHKWRRLPWMEMDCGSKELISVMGSIASGIAGRAPPPPHFTIFPVGVYFVSVYYGARSRPVAMGAREPALKASASTRRRPKYLQTVKKCVFDRRVPTSWYVEGWTGTASIV